MKKTFGTAFLGLLLVVGGCATGSDLKIFIAEGGALQYFIPPTEWKPVEGEKIAAKLDITYRDAEEFEAIVNISFTGKTNTPHEAASLSLNGDGAALPLKNTKVIYLKPGAKELRISSNISREDLMTILSASAVELAALIDGGEYRFASSKQFAALRAELLESLVYGH
ncbi:MAG: hypothetical protein LBQ55_01535 [Treponema sp.]|jgi:hypothetical protein|nr:hypothetical protein [Treponema sp.]